MKVPFDPKTLFSLPWAQTILGTQVRGKANFMALDWVTRVNFNPPMMGICVNKTSASYDAICETQEFSINLPSVDLLEVTDYVGIVSGKEVDKSGLFGVFYGDLKAAPMILECPVSLECAVTQTVDLPTNAFFIGDIVNIFTETKYLTDGTPDVRKIKPFLLTMPDNRFWSVGDRLGQAWSTGRGLLKEES